MINSQEYELKIGVYHHPSLKTNQLIEFLKNESNDFLNSELPQNLMVREAFYSSFDQVTQTEPIDFNEYIGLIVLYSSTSNDSFDYARRCIPPADLLGSDIFLLLVEMDNTEKKMNEVGAKGEQLSQQLGLSFIRLTLTNSQELVATLNRNIYLMIENYYYPNEEERNRATFECQTHSEDFQLDYVDSEQKIVATTEEKRQVMGLIEKAALLRSSRQKQMVAEQSALDQSIENVEKVLNNINKHIKQKLDSDWFTSLKDSLYKPIEKQSRTYNKIKLTQEFVEEPLFAKSKKNSQMRTADLNDNIFNSKFNSTLQQQFKRLDSALIKIVIVLDNEQSDRFDQSKMVELQVYENSTYEQLTANALRKLGLSDTEKNLKLMREHIRSKLQSYLRQLSRGVRKLQRERTYQRSYLAVLKK